MPATSSATAIQYIEGRRLIMMGDCGHMLITTKTRQESERAPSTIFLKILIICFQILHSKPTRGTKAMLIQCLLYVFSRMQSILHVPDPSSLVRRDAFKPCLHGTLPPFCLAQWHQISPLLNLNALPYDINSSNTHLPAFQASGARS